MAKPDRLITQKTTIKQVGRRSGVMGGPEGGSGGQPRAAKSFDGLLVSWEPGSTALERTAAREVLGLSLRETIQTASMKRSGAGVLEWVDLPKGLSAEQAIANIGRRPGVAYAEKNWQLDPQATSNDPDVANGKLWGMYGESSSPANAFGSHATEAWGQGFTGDSNVYVGIIDEGYQYTHADLTGNASVNPGEIAGNSIDDDGNGYIDDVYGWDFAGNNNSVYDGTGDDHGTHVAGTIGGKGNNGIGVAGVSWNVSMLSGKFLGATGGTTANAIKAVDYFTDLKIRHGIKLVATNNSWGGGGYSQGLYDAIARANAANIFFVAAAGNSSTSTLSYPAGYDLPNVISVASIDSNGGLSSFSNFSSSWVDLGAPGGGIYSTLPDNTYGTYSGTSMATPHVTGVLALMAASQPTASMGQLKQALLESVVPTTSLAGKTSTGGRLNVNDAITRLSELVNPNAPTYAVNSPAPLNEGSTLSFTIATTNLPENTKLYWTFSGAGVSIADFSGLTALNGTTTIGPDGRATLPTTPVINDLITEGNETLRLDVFSDASLTRRVTGTAAILIDTSQTPGVTLWGTTASQSITGGLGQDRLAGVPEKGIAAAEMGAGQIDNLTGLNSNDVFLLGDQRGVFYDDRIAGNLGTSDYARIQDFAPGLDKLQVRAGTSYLYRSGSNGLSLYWDRNSNGSLNTSGTNRDELIAILTGVSAISATDLVTI